MARPGVTYLEVANAAQQLTASGRLPTIESIRIILGTGSNSTLGAHLRTWKSKQGDTAEANRENLPEELLAALKGVWQRVMDQSEEIIQTIKQEHEQKFSELDGSYQILHKDYTLLQQTQYQTKQERDCLTSEKNAIEEILANAKIENAKSSEKIDAMMEQNQEKQARIDELNQQNKQAQANLEHYRASSLEQRLIDKERYELQQKQLEQTILDHNQQLSRYKQDKAVLEKENHEIKFENNTVTKQLEKLQNQYQAVTKETTHLVGELAKKTQAETHWKQQYQTLQLKCEEQSQILSDLKSQHAMLQQQSETMGKELHELREQNKALAHEKWILGQEKAQLYGQLTQLSSTKKKAPETVA